MNGARQQFLAGAAFAGDQHRLIRLLEPPDQRSDLAHGRAVADDRRRFEPRGAPCPGDPRSRRAGPAVSGLSGAFQQQAGQPLRRHTGQVVEADARDRGAFDA